MSSAAELDVSNSVEARKLAPGCWRPGDLGCWTHTGYTYFVYFYTLYAYPPFFSFQKIFTVEPSNTLTVRTS